MIINRWINNLIIVFLFIFPISIAGTNAVLVLLVVFWIVEGDFKNKFSMLLKTKLILVLSVLILLLLISTLLSESCSNAFLLSDRASSEPLFIIKHFIWLSFFYIIYITSVRPQNNSKLLNAFLIAIFFSEFTSYLVFFEVIDAPSFIKNGLLIREASANFPVPFMHHTFYSFFLSVAILFLVDQLFRYHNSRAKQIFIAIFLTSAIVNLFINGGRTGQLALIIGILIYTTLKFEKKYIFVAMGFLIGIFILAYNFSPMFKERATMASSDISKMTENDFNTSWGARMAVNITVYHYFLDSTSNFVFGAGAGDAKKEFNDFAKENMPDTISYAVKDLSHLHNQYIQSWMDGSIFSLLLLLLLFYFFIKTATDENRHLVVAIAGIMAFSFIPDVMLYRSQTYLLVLFVFAYFTIEKRKKLEENQEANTSYSSK